MPCSNVESNCRSPFSDQYLTRPCNCPLSLFSSASFCPLWYQAVLAPFSLPRVTWPSNLMRPFRCHSVYGPSLVFER